MDPTTALKNDLIPNCDFCSGPGGEDARATGAEDGCHPFYSENPILVDLLALAIRIMAGHELATKTSANDSTAGSVVRRDGGT
jgi:hypothetical protein